MHYKLIKLFAIAALASLIIPRVDMAGAKVYDLEAPKDVISNSTPDALAFHNIRFGLPAGGAPLLSTDYIIIQLVYFTNLHNPYSMGGGFTGTPVYSISGNTLKITGISASTDTYLEINNLQAKNPALIEAWDVYLMVSSDSNGQDLKYQSRIMATDYDGSVLVRAEIPPDNGQVRVRGYGAPSMLVAFLEDNVAIGTCLTESTGAFSQVLSGLKPGQHTIQIYGTDQQNRSTPTVEISVFIRAYILVELPLVIIPPTISLDKDEILRGEALTVSGSGIPGYTATISTESPLENFQTTVGQTGEYSYTITDTNDWDFGDHKAYSILQDSDGNSSQFSFEQIFKVVDEDASNADHPSCDISEGDLSCDGHTNLTDFSILLYHWGTSSAFGDINGDKNVNLIDFSIMMFYWQT